MFCLSVSLIITLNVLIKAKAMSSLFTSAQAAPDSDSPIACRERLGGLLTYYHRKAEINTSETSSEIACQIGCSLEATAITAGYMMQEG
jgi:hypothetical protein